MIGKYYNDYNDDDYDDDDDDRFYHVEEESEKEKEEENTKSNNLKEEAMEGNLRALEVSWFITISSTKIEYKLAVISIVSMRLLKTVTSKDGYTRTNYDGLEFLTSAGRFVCKGIMRADDLYRNLSANFKEWIPYRIISCESVEFIPWVSLQDGNPDNDNHANQLNPNNAEYNHSRDKN